MNGPTTSSFSTEARRTLCRSIWEAGVAAVDSRRLVVESLRAGPDWIAVGGEEFFVGTNSRIVVVGAGKAGAGMASGAEEVLLPFFRDRIEGWINVPADCVRSLERVHLHAARPAGVNEPTPEGVAGSQRILEMVGSLGEDDLCLVLLSGGGSALLPAPVPEVGLEAKLAVTRALSRAGATIQELNCVRKQLSQIKGGGLARACRARMACLIISDVAGDPLETIASGPTVPNTETAADALAALNRLTPDRSAIPGVVWDYLEGQVAQESLAGASGRCDRVLNRVIGNNRTAVNASAQAAMELGLRVEVLGSDLAGVAREVGTELAERAIAVRSELPDSAPAVCLISGGEPVVQVVKTALKQKGGRNQELVLAAAVRLLAEGSQDGITILSGGTDGEDGPTDAAGAMCDEAVLASARSLGLDPAEFLAVNNSYPFFEQTGGLLKTGPTHTNVMDLRVVLVSPPAPEA
jgi:glycerate 2-kinase